MSQKLNEILLQNLPNNIDGLKYDRNKLSVGVVHIGMGNFHRSHQAIYFNKLFNKGLDHDWGIIGAGIMPSDVNMRNKMLQQDCLYTVIEMHPEKYYAQICGSVIDFVQISSQGLFDAMCKAEIRIVSLTVTEGGYYIDSKHGGFNNVHPDIVAEKEHFDNPKTVFGNIVKALKFRKENNLNPFTILSCDNLPQNGHVTKNAVIGMAKIIAPEIISWINKNVTFPSSMVDRITPATSEKELNFVKENFAIDDKCVVMCEPYSQWVIEDNFVCGRPNFEKVGVEFVDDVAAYELMKLRILNASHAAISYPSYLMGIEYVHEAMSNDVIRNYFDRLIKEEAIPTVPQIKGINFDQYFKKTKERFANPKMLDTIERLCMDGSNRQPKFIFPTILDRLQKKKNVKGLALEVALWCRFCAGIDENGKEFKLNDINEARLKENALKAKNNPEIFLNMDDIFGKLSESKVFSEQFADALNSIWQTGVKKTLRKYST